jgi:hypothetical protein
LSGKGPDIGARRDESKPQSLRQVAAERLVLIRFGPKPVVEMCGGHFETMGTAPSKLDQRVSQGHGIGSAGQSDENAVARLNHSVALDGPSYLCDEHLDPYSSRTIRHGHPRFVESH